MGIRIHKMLGYGLTDVKVDKYTVIDPRVNPEGIIGKSRFDNEKRWADTDAFLEWTAAQDKATHSLDKILVGIWRDTHQEQKEEWDIQPLSCFVQETEYGIPEVLCIRPVAQWKWVRYGDTLDWTEETYCNEQRQRNWVKLLPDGIYPYSGFYMDARTGEIFRQERSYAAIEWQRILNPEWGPVPEEQKLDEIARVFGFGETAEEARQNVVPMIPEEIRYLCQWGEAFTDESVINQLRPMIYVYWA